MKQDGRKNFIRMIEQISKGNNSSAVNITAELGTMKAGGVLPDSYPEGSEPDDDYLVLSGIETAEGDRVLLAETFAAYKEGLKKKIVKANEDLKDVKYEYKTN